MKPKYNIGYWPGRVQAGSLEPRLRKNTTAWMEKFGAWIKAQLCQWIPEGHEDEAGFHFGPVPTAPVPPAAAGEMSKAGQAH